jgi:hypothetical protein
MDATPENDLAADATDIPAANMLESHKQLNPGNRWETVQ